MIRRMILSAAVFCAVAATAQSLLAGPVFNFDGTTENNVFFQDRGVVLRANANASYGGLAGYERVDVGAPILDGGGNVIGFVLPQAGDIEIEIFRAQNIEAPEGQAPPGWETSAGDRFSGYAAFELSADPFIDPSTGLLQVNFKPLSVADPFGILDTSNNEVLALFVNDGPEAVTDWLPNGSSLGAGVSSATDGDLWATFGFSGTQGSDGYLYQRNDLPGGNPQSGTGFAALNVIQQPLLPGVVFTGVNDPTEDVFGGTSLITDIWAQQKFRRNSTFDPSTAGSDSTKSFWQFSSDDPLVFAAVPEPSSMILLTGLFGGVLGYTRLRRKKNA